MFNGDQFVSARSQTFNSFQGNPMFYPLHISTSKKIRGEDLNMTTAFFIPEQHNLQVAVYGCWYTPLMKEQKIKLTDMFKIPKQNMTDNWITTVNESEMKVLIEYNQN